MLKICNVTKVYEMGNQKVKALKGISLEFRKSEFVSILGPSGCGKTTLLNIIGGLDRYTSGDLIINNKSTKQYKNKDWDTYRNHSIGFVFQSYNLIPHQTVLENVELALTLSGVSREERKKRAKKVLEKVGLKDKLNNKPNQLSGGQMQRVAIARALVNDPDIILADEPTGALDSNTSIQIMKLLKEISKDKLIIMVTHNPDLAKEYSSRIVKLLDGELLEDSNPYNSESSNKTEKLESMEEDRNLTKSELKKKNKKKRMSFFTALFLSFKNLLTKKGRTFLVSFAGSIGIIGIAIILAISSGFSTYVNKMQEDTLSSYPITIEAKSIDFSTVIMSLFMANSEETTSQTHEEDGVYPKDKISNILDTIGSAAKPNNLKKFYAYIKDHEDELRKNTSAIKYSYDIGLQFLSSNEGKTSFSQEDMIQPYSTALYKTIIMYSLSYFEYNAHVNIEYVGDKKYRIEKLDNTNFIEVAKYLNEDKTTELQTTGETELTEPEIQYIINSMLGGTVDLSQYRYASTSAFSELIDNDELINNSYEVIAQTEDYSGNANEAILVLNENSEVDDYVLYSLGLLSDEDMNTILNNYITGEQQPVMVDFETVLGKTFTVLTKSDLYKLDTETNKYFDINEYINEGTEHYDETLGAMKYATAFNQAYLNSTNTVKIAKIIRLKKQAKTNWVTPGVVYSKDFTDEMISYSNSSLAVTSGDLSEITKDNPTQIKIYVNTFEAKDKIKDFIAKYNKQAEQGDEITYSDMVGTIMSTVSTIITAITYVLIAFVSVSLIVSSIMIGIITYISVIERTKEIGVLRSVGASKRDVKRVFTAESFIIGLSSGIIGILVSLLLTIPINLVLQSYTGIVGLAHLPALGATILILVSVVLTFIAGLIPARAASKKDPVIALRTE